MTTTKPNPTSQRVLDGWLYAVRPDGRIHRKYVNGDGLLLMEWPIAVDKSGLEHAVSRTVSLLYFHTPLRFRAVQLHDVAYFGAPNSSSLVAEFRRKFLVQWRDPEYQEDFVRRQITEAMQAYEARQ